MTFDEIDRRIEQSPDLFGTTVNERLILCGLLDEFEFCKANDMEKVRYILNKLGFEINDINKILLE